MHINAVSLLPNFEISSVQVDPPSHFVEGVVEDVSDEIESTGGDEIIFHKNSELKMNENSFCEKCSCDNCLNEKLARVKDEGVENNTTPNKLQDPGVPLLSIHIGAFKTEWALLDLGACISIMPGSLYDKYEFGPLQEANTTVVLADQTHTLPRGMIYNVMVHVEDFCYPVDFLVLVMLKV